LKIEKKSIEKNKIRFYYYIGSISSILILVILLSIIYSRSLNNEYLKKIDQLSSGIIREKKQFLRNAVERTIFFIKTERELVQKMSVSENLTPQQIDELSIERISSRIRNLRLIDNGYLWVNRIVDYKGGDKYAIRQIHPNLPNTEGDWLSTKTTDIMGNKPYEIELNGIKKDGEIFFEYYFKKLDSEKIAHKMSFAKLYAPWNWIVVTGVYLDDVDQLIQAQTEDMEKTLKIQRMYSFFIAAVIMLFSSLILIRFEKQISRLISSYEKDIDNYTSNLLREKEKIEIALAEIKQLKGLLPICAQCKKIRDDKGYWNQIEGYIQKHSDAKFSHGICPECSDELYGKEDWYIEMKKEQNEKK
jgi:signal transduction histidine kinase